MALSLSFRRVLFVFLCASLFFVPHVVLAQGGVDVGSGVVEGGSSLGNVGYGFDETVQNSNLPNQDTDIYGFVGKLINVLLGLVATIFFVLMVYGGFLWMTARGNSEQAGKAKTLIIQSIIGSVIIAAAWAITNFVIGALQQI